MFCKPRKKSKLRQIVLGMEVKRCADCDGHVRPCLVDGKPATFHRWVEEDKALLKVNAFLKHEYLERVARRFREEGVLDNASSVEKLRTCFALVEYPDGSVGKVRPELIQFLDRKGG